MFIYVLSRDLEKPNKKSNKPLLTAKKLNKITHTLSKTSILFNKPTAKPC
jgi:hypothetical protein